jgi:hypothetical protein
VCSGLACCGEDAQARLAWSPRWSGQGCGNEYASAHRFVFASTGGEGVIGDLVLYTRPELCRDWTCAQPFTHRPASPVQGQFRTGHAAALPLDSAELAADLPDTGLPAAGTPVDVSPGAVMPVARMVQVIHLA